MKDVTSSQPSGNLRGFTCCLPLLSRSRSIQQSLRVAGARARGAATGGARRQEGGVRQGAGTQWGRGRAHSLRVHILVAHRLQAAVVHGLRRVLEDLRSDAAADKIPAVRRERDK